MRTLKRVLIVVVGLWLLYIAYLYIASPKATYLIKKGYEGPLLIIANQEDGIEINPKHAIYDFTKGNVIKLKGNLVEGFFPWGYLNYYSVNENGEKENLKSIDSEGQDDQIYILDNYYTSGGCEAKNVKVYYESIIVGKESNVFRIVSEKNKLINEVACSGQ